MAQISSKYGAHVTQINLWKKQVVAQLPDVISNRNKQLATDHDTQLGELYEQIGRLKVENDFLKKNLSCSMDDRRNWIESNHALLSVRQQCEILNLSRSSIYYTPRPKVYSDEQLALLRLMKLIQNIHSLAQDK